MHLPYIHKPLTMLLNNIVLQFKTEFVISDTFTLYSNKMFDIENQKKNSVVNELFLTVLNTFVIIDPFTL